MSIGALDPIANAQAWDVISLAGSVTPGWADVTQFIREHKLDKKMGKGTDGATTTYVGKPPAGSPIKFYLWTSEHFQTWDRIIPALKYDPAKGKGLVPVDIFHPALADIDVTSVVAEKLGSYVHEGNQLYSREIYFSEYHPPPKASAVSTASGSKGTGSGGAGGNPPPGTQPDPELESLRKTAASLAADASQAYQ